MVNNVIPPRYTSVAFILCDLSATPVPSIHDIFTFLHGFPFRNLYLLGYGFFGEGGEGGGHPYSGVLKTATSVHTGTYVHLPHRVAPNPCAESEEGEPRQNQTRIVVRRGAFSAETQRVRCFHSVALQQNGLPTHRRNSRFNFDAYTALRICCMKWVDFQSLQLLL